MKPDEEQLNGVCKTEKPVWHFNLRRISSSRAEILDLNNSANNNNTNKKNRFENTKSSTKTYFNKSFDDYIYNIKRDKQHHSDALDSINLINTPLVDLPSSEFDRDDNPVMLRLSRTSDVDENSTTANSSIAKQLTNNEDITFDVNHSLIDQIFSIRDKLVKIKRRSSSEDSEEATSVKRLSKIDVNVIRANSKLNRSNNANSQSETASKQNIIKSQMNKIKNNVPTFSLNKNNNTETDQSLNTECIFEHLNKLGASSVPNDSFQHVLLEEKNSRSLGNHSSLPNLKCEFIYGERLYWVVKIKRYFRNLFQIKLVKNPPALGMTSTVSLSNLSLPLHVSTLHKRNSENYDLDAFRQEPNTISPNSSVYSAHSDSKSETKLAETTLTENISDGFFFSIDKKIPDFLSKLRPIGWSKSNGYFSQKPDIEKLLNDNSQHETTEFNNIEIQSYFAKYSTASIDYREGSYYELESCKVDNHVDIIRIKKNIAGRLLAEFSDQHEMNSEWLFYLNTSLHPLGWAKMNNMNYSEDSLKNKFDIEQCQNLSNPASNQQKDLYSQLNQIELRHERQQYFKLNHYLEFLHVNRFYAARVCEVQNDVYFKIQLTSKDNQINGRIFKFYLTSNVLSCIFPCKWCAKLNLVLEPPADWLEADSAFDWNTYIDMLNFREQRSSFALTEDLAIFNWQRSLTNLAEKFQVGAYLECVDRTAKADTKNEIVCLGQIKAKLAHLIFVKLIKENSDQDRLHVFSADSVNIFPVGWCEMNNYYGDFRRYKQFYKFPVTGLNKELDDRISGNLSQSILTNSCFFSRFNDKETWCDRIYLHTSCNTGPYFSKQKLNCLPRVFGPGPIILVVSKLVQMLINASDKPGKLIKLLQASSRRITLQLQTPASSEGSVPDFGKLRNMQRVRLKAKDKGKYIFKELEICTHFSQLSEYLADLCHKLKCCNQMVNLRHELVNDNELNRRFKICVEVKCCLLCTINYLSSPTAVLDQQHTSKSSSKLNTLGPFQNGQAKQQRAKDNQSNPPIKTLNTQKSASRLGIVQQQQNNNTSDLSNHSPIKTRLNVRQTLLQQEELDRIQQLKEIEKRAKTPEVTIINEKMSPTKRLKLKNNGVVQYEPPVKKSRKSKNSEQNITNTNTSNTSIKMSPSHASKASLPASNNHSDSPNSSIVNSSFPGSNNASFNNGNIAEAPSLHQQHQLLTNPIYWQSEDISRYLAENKFEPHLIYLIKEHEIDGQSFLMLSLPTIQNYMKLKLGPAIKLAHLVEKLKQIYFNQFKGDS